MHLRKDFSDSKDDEHKHEQYDKDDGDGGERQMRDTLCFVVVFNIHKVNQCFLKYCSKLNDIDKKTLQECKTALTSQY